MDYKITDLVKMFEEIDPDRDLEREDSSDDEEDANKQCQTTVPKGPGDISAKSKPVAASDANNVADKKPSAKEKKNPKVIWGEKEPIVNPAGDKEAFDVDNVSIRNDPRKTPHYEMHYRQTVTTEDVFLQVGRKTPGTSSCENLVVEVHLPGEKLQDIQLNLKKQGVDLRSPKHFLYLNLPHPIDTRAGNAKWDKEKEMLVVTLRLQRELDDFNF